MFNNIGGKIKNTAKVFLGVGIVGSLIGGIVILASGMSSISWIGIVVIIVGTLISWPCSAVLYAFGELVENSSIIAKGCKNHAVSINGTKNVGNENNGGNSSGHYDYARSSDGTSNVDNEYNGGNGSNAHNKKPLSANEEKIERLEKWHTLGYISDEEFESEMSKLRENKDGRY